MCFDYMFLQKIQRMNWLYEQQLNFRENTKEIVTYLQTEEDC